MKEMSTEKKKTPVTANKVNQLTQITENCVNSVTAVFVAWKKRGSAPDGLDISQIK